MARFEMTEKSWLRLRRSVFDLQLQRIAKNQHRKWRLFGAACCRRAIDKIQESRLEPVIDVAERFADNLANWEEVKITRRLLIRLRQPTPKKRVPAVVRMVNDAVEACNEVSHRLPSHALEAHRHAAKVVAALGRSDRLTNGLAGYVRPSNWAMELADERESREQVRLARDIFGNPFRPVAFDPSWRTPTSIALSTRMYDSRDFDVMPILADALEEAGCTNTDVLLHCREPGIHVRGCWVVDHVLGKV